MLVRELMTPRVITIPDTASAHDAVETMVRHKIRHLPVVGVDGALRGIVTDRDLRHFIFEPDVLREIGRRPVDDLLSSARLADLMSSPVTTTQPDASVAEAARSMLEASVGSLPVVDGTRVVGIVTETDLLRRIVGEDACCADVATIVVSYP